MADKLYTEDQTTKLHEQVIHKHNMFPFWIFADIKCEGTPKKFWCFLGAHYPRGLVETDEVEYEAAIEELEKGHWKAKGLTAYGPNSKIGFGVAETPSLAFISACKMAGYIKAQS
jgi:hypothetical protein